MYSINKNRTLSLLFILGALILAGCSSNSNYVKAKSIPPIKVNDNQDKERVGEIYRVPDIKNSDKLPAKFKVPLPPAVGVQDDAKIASLEVMGKTFWVLNAQTPATTWSRLENYWQTIQVPLVTRDLSSARIETKWFRHEALQPDFAVRYQLRLEKGLQAGTTEIHFINTKKPVSEIKDFSDPWPTTLEDSLHARVIADEIVNSLNDNRFIAGDSLLATRIDLPDKVKLFDGSDEVVLTTSVSKPRLIRAFDKALNSDGFSIYETNTDKMVFHFDEDQAKSKSSWLSKIANISKYLSSEGARKSSRQSNYTLQEILTNLPQEPEVDELFSTLRPVSENVKKLSGVPGYLLVAREESDNTVIYIRDGYGKKVDTETAKEILDSIRLRLI